MKRAEDKRSPNGRNHIMYICGCDCGKQVVVKAENLRSGNTKSCGCLSLEKSKERLKKHGMHGTRIYVIWQGMKSRCNNPHNLSYANYGNRGIKVCDEWQNDFEVFEYWAYKNGYKDNLTLDRINNGKGKYMNGWLIRPFRHFCCGMIRGHKWKNTSPFGMRWLCQECVYCGKERVV